MLSRNSKTRVHFSTVSYFGNKVCQHRLSFQNPSMGFAVCCICSGKIVHCWNKLTKFLRRRLLVSGPHDLDLWPAYPKTVSVTLMRRNIPTKFKVLRHFILDLRARTGWQMQVLRQCHSSLYGQLYRNVLYFYHKEIQKKKLVPYRSYGKMNYDESTTLSYYISSLRPRLVLLCLPACCFQWQADCMRLTGSYRAPTTTDLMSLPE